MSKRAERSDATSPTSKPRSSLRALPSVEKTLARPGIQSLVDEFGRPSVVEATRAALADLRERLLRGGEEPPDDALLESSIEARLRDVLRPSLLRVVNATGVLVHTNLGRAPLSAEAIAAVAEVARGYSNLELDLSTGKRGSRHRHAEKLLLALFPEKRALVVNNAAAAVMLSLNTFASGKEVVISRGELVEIGGAFRVPEILARSGARLREVGTTNKTRLSDYEKALGAETGAILRVHPSNFRIVGFTEAVPTTELVRLGRAHSLPVIEDFGSGNLLPLAAYGLAEEPTVAESLASGVDLCIFSGDKLLGGPQAGLLIGDGERIEACRRNPMARALRVDKLVYAALEATLAAYVRGRAFEEIPVLRMLGASPEEIRARATSFVTRLSGVAGLSLEVQTGSSRVGGGAAPSTELPTTVVAVEVRGLSSDSLLSALRRHETPVIARIADDRVLLDFRTVAAEEERIVEAALRSLAGE